MFFYHTKDCQDMETQQASPLSFCLLLSLTKSTAQNLLRQPTTRQLGCSSYLACYNHGRPTNPSEAMQFTHRRWNVQAVRFHGWQLKVQAAPQSTSLGFTWANLVKSPHRATTHRQDGDGYAVPLGSPTDAASWLGAAVAPGSDGGKKQRR